MAARNPQLNWDRLLDGGTYTLKLDDIGWQRGLNDLRAKVHYEADRRRGIAHTHKVDAWTLEIWAEQCRVKTVPEPCTCGTDPWEGHVVSCAKIKRPSLRQAAPPAPAEVADPWESLTFAGPAPQDQPPTPTSEPFEADDEALLGPCTCGQAPQCQPDCARVAG
jgi:hypothetical protein